MPQAAHVLCETVRDTMRVAIYARVSTKDKGQEVENQLRQLREFAVLQGWTVYCEFIDHETGFRPCSEMPASASLTCCCSGR
jgi:hypothetical protein